MKEMPEWSIHVVHPYTYKIDADHNVIGPIGRYTDRDGALGKIFSHSYEHNMPLVNYWRSSQRTFEGMMEVVGLSMDPNFEHLLDSRVIDITTCRNGVPLKNHRPAEVRRKHYSVLRKFIDREVTIQRKTPRTKNALFLGGVYELCLGSFVNWYCTQARPEGQRMVLVPDLSVSFDCDKFTCVQRTLAERGVVEMTKGQILEELGCNQTVISS